MFSQSGPTMKLTKFIRDILKIYYKFTAASFFVFLFCVFSFGRSFSILHINTPIAPVFVTEIFILLNIPILIYKFKELNKLPRVFLFLLLTLFFLGFSYLAVGIFQKNMFALRDITLFLYILFLPISLIHLDALKKIKVCLGIVITANMVGLFSGRCLLMQIYPAGALHNLFSEGKLFNFGLYYGIASALMISFYHRIKPGIYRLSVLTVLALNTYMFITIAKSSIWAAVLATFIFLSILLKARLLKFIIPFSLVFILISSTIFCFDSFSDPAFHQSRILEKAKSISLFFRGVQYKYEPGPAPLQKKYNKIKNNLRVSLKKEVVPIPLAQESTYVYLKKEVARAPLTEERGLDKVVRQNESEKSAEVQTPLAQGSPDVHLKTEVVKTSPPDETGLGKVVRKNEPKRAMAKRKISLSKTERIAKPTKESTLQSLGNIAWRFNIWKQTLKYCSDSPFFGMGFGVYPVYEIWGTYQSPKNLYNDSGIVPVHNHLLTLFFKMGILGLGLFLFINIYVFIYALSYLKKCNLKFTNDLLIGLLGSFVFWQVLALFFDVIDSPPTSIFLWIIIGLIFSAIEIDKNSKQLIQE